MIKKSKEDIAQDELKFELYHYKKQQNFNNWIYSKIRPHLKGDILETGSGIGTFSEKLIKDFAGKIYLTEITLEFINELKKQFNDKEKVTITPLNLNKKKDFLKINSKFDSILCSHVLEHVKDDVLALKLLKTLLNPKGVLIIVVPCHRFLYSQMDIVEGHYRRYAKKELEEKTKLAGLKIKYAFWFNMFAIPARFINGNLFGANKTHQGSFRLYNKLIPIIRFFEEEIFNNIIGINRVIILENES